MISSADSPRLIPRFSSIGLKCVMRQPVLLVLTSRRGLLRRPNACVQSVVRHFTERIYGSLPACESIVLIVQIGFRWRLARNS